MIAVHVQVEDQATPVLRALLGSAQGPSLLRVGARGAANRLREHFDHLQATRPNALGGKRVNFWLQVKRGVQVPVVAGTTARISINHVGFRQRLQGGVIRPGRSINPRTGRPTTRLAIPLRSEVYGQRPAERDDLDYVPLANGRALLVESAHTQIRIGRARKDGTRKVTPGEERGGLAMYLLTPQVRQDPDPSVLPTSAELGAAAVAAMDSAVAAQVARGGGPTP